MMEEIKLKNDKNILIIISVMILIILICIILILVAMHINKTNNNDGEYDEIANMEEGGEEYHKEHLKNMNFEVTNLSSDIKSRIKDVNQFLIDMKEYIYLNGLVQANLAECINIGEEENKIILQFRLNNPEKTIISVNINLKDNTYEFSDNYLSN